MNHTPRTRTSGPSGSTPQPATRAVSDTPRWAPNILGVHLYLENPAGEVLLGLRHPDSAFGANTWHFLAGHCEDESALTCLIREAEEEAGLRIKAEDAELVHTVHMRGEPDGRPRLGLVFRVRRWEGRPEVREPDRCVGWQWWQPEHLPAAIVPYTRTAIEGIRAGRAYTELRWT